MNELLSQNDISALWLSLKLALVATAILLLIGTPIAWWLANTRFKFKAAIEAVVALPLVLPPTVLGFYLLVALGPNGPLAPLLHILGIERLTFNFSGLVIASTIYSFPFVVQPLQQAFSQVSKQDLEAAATLGAGAFDRFCSIALPLSRAGYLTATVLGIAHTIGEFGVVLMIGGNIPGQTQVLSIAIYDHVEALEYGHAHILSAGLLIFTFLLLIAVYFLNRRFAVLRS